MFLHAHSFMQIPQTCFIFFHLLRVAPMMLLVSCVFALVKRYSWTISFHCCHISLFWVLILGIAVCFCLVQCTLLLVWKTEASSRLMTSTRGSWKERSQWELLMRRMKQRWLLRLLPRHRRRLPLHRFHFLLNFLVRCTCICELLSMEKQAIKATA